MNKDLYFIKLISKAFEKKDLRNSLKSAIETIREESKDISLQRGYHQYLRFMEEVESFIVEHSLSDDEKADLDIFFRDSSLKIFLEKEESQIAEIVWNELCQTWFIDEIKPGKFCLKLETGQIIWRGEFSLSDLIWEEAFPGEGLEMAASTGGKPEKHSRVINLNEFGLCMKVFPGIESGSLKIIGNPEGE